MGNTARFEASDHLNWLCPANAPNSIPPERVFSILNDTFDDDMDNSHADYIELSLQLQFNSRTRE